MKRGLKRFTFETLHSRKSSICGKRFAVLLQHAETNRVSKGNYPLWPPEAIRLPGQFQSWIAPAVLCLFLFILPVQAGAAELGIRNTAQCDARVALAYQRGGLDIVEGWYKLKPGQELTVHLYAVGTENVYAHAVFEYPHENPSLDPDTPVRERDVQDTHFRYAGTPKNDPAMYKARFRRIVPFGEDAAVSGGTGGSRNLVFVLKAR